MVSQLPLIPEAPGPSRKVVFGRVSLMESVGVPTVAGSDRPPWYPEPGLEVSHGTLNIRAFKHSLPNPNVSYFTTRSAPDWGLTQDFSDECDGAGGVRTKPVLCTDDTDNIRDTTNMSLKVLECAFITKNHTKFAEL